MDDEAVGHRELDLRVADGAGVEREQVAVDQHEVGPLADLERARVGVVVVDVRRPDGEPRERLGERDRLGGEERVSRAVVRSGARDRDLHLRQRIRGRDRPVRAHREDGTVPGEVAERIHLVDAVLPEERHRELVHLRIALSPVGLGVHDRIEVAEAREIVGVHDLHVGEMVAKVVPSVDADGVLDGVEREAYGTVADRVQVHLEAESAELGERVLEDVGVDELQTGVVRVAATPVAVRGEERACVVLEHAVGHHLDRGGEEASAEAALAKRDELGDLLHASVAVPPERADHAGGECVPRRKRDVGVQRLGSHPGVLPRRDAEGVQVGLSVEDRGFPLVLIRLGHDAVLERVRRPLVQHAREPALGVALVPAVGGVGDRVVDAGDRERLAVDPGSVGVLVEQEHRAVRHDRVEVVLVRVAARKVLHRPAAALDPLAVRVCVGVGLDLGEVVLPAVGVQEVEVQPVATGEGRMDVGVLESRSDELARSVDHPGRGPDELLDLLGRSDGDDAVAAYGDAAGPAADGVAGVDVAEDHQVCGHGHAAPAVRVRGGGAHPGASTSEAPGCRACGCSGSVSS